MKKARVELRLELLYVTADRRAADAQAIARSGKAALVGDGQKSNNTGVTGGKTACKRISGASGRLAWVRYESASRGVHTRLDV
ncbi:hypothetical protein GCM10027278_13200 [Paralcaligenes ginsengisoli]